MKNNLVKNKLFVILSMFSAVSLLFSPIIFTSASIYATDPIHILGDINNDGAINTLDVILLRLILLERADPDFHSDVDLNTIINTNDFEALIDIIFGIIDSHFGGGGGGGGGGGAVNNIPTPTPTSTPTPVTWYQDADVDGYGNPSVSTQSSTQPSGYVLDNTDCDDTDPNVHPNATEIPYNGKNDDCNSSTSDDDMDHDGHSGTSDCNDNDPAVWQTRTGYTDNDHDSYGAGTGQDICSGASLPVGYADNNTDCDDTDPNVHPNATEIPYNGEDDDCNPSTLEDDLDGDGYKKDNDCDDTNAAVYPGAPEICDGIDNDCDGKVDLIDSGVHHLGDDAYSGSANSQLYIPTEGFTYSKAFTVNMTQSFTKATLSITHRGVQKDDPIKINGQLICAEWDSPSDGSLGTSTISFNINILQAGANTISITAYQDSWSHDYDDFEFTNIYIKLSN